MIQLNWYQIFGQSIPDGRTVTPTDDIQIWLHCANIWDKNYTTLAQVLADTDTLVALMASDNAVDYLVRSTSWAGISLVPIMTSNTTPSGVVSGTSDAGGDSALYKAFDGDGTTKAGFSSALSTGYIQYEFPNPEEITRFKYRITFGTGRDVTIRISYSDNGVDFTNVAETQTYLSTDNGAVKYYDFTPCGSHKYWRLTRTCSPASATIAHDIQYYFNNLCDSEIAMKSIGASDYASTTLLSDSTWCDAIYGSSYFDYVANVAVPKMTSNTAPSGTCIQSGVASGVYAYQAFDRDDSTDFYTNAAISGAYVGYTFPAAHKISKSKMLIKTNASSESHYTYKVQGSNDGFSSDVHDLTDAFNITLANQGSVWVDKELVNTDAYKSFRLYSTVTLETSRRMVVSTMQIFDREPGGVQTWLHAAGITNKNYTTLSEVLADTSTLSTLINNHSACDYLVTCKGWATTICADSTAMTCIGLNNYCANKLLADATWRTAICNSTYFESVLNVKVPAMTGYTTPSGVASANTEYSAYYPAWKALDGVNSPDGMDCWHSKQRADHWIQYKFADTSFRVLKIAITDRYTGAWNGTVNLTFKRSSDGPAIYTTSYTQADNSQHSFVITNDNSGDTCRLELTTSSSGYVTIGILNFYGREDV